MKELPYYDQLVQIRQLLEEEVKGFPKGECQTATRLVQLIVGLRGGGGEYHYNNTHESHYWNQDTEHKLYIDLSLDQFDKRRKAISIFPDSTKILEAVFMFDTDYLPGCNEPSFKKEIKKLLKLYEEKYGRVCPVVGS